MDVTFAYNPLPIHEQFHRSLTRVRIMFGAFGSGGGGDTFLIPGLLRQDSSKNQRPPLAFSTSLVAIR